MSIRSRPSGCCGRSSRPPTSAPPTRRAPRDAGRWRVHAAVRLRLQTLTDLPYDRWREYDPEDTLRFYALRLHEAGMITSTPTKIIAEGTDWRFLDELKRELKA